MPMTTDGVAISPWTVAASIKPEKKELISGVPAGPQSRLGRVHPTGHGSQQRTYCTVPRSLQSTPSLQAISTTLTQDQLIRESDTFDASKFTLDALRQLYASTTDSRAAKLAAGTVNGAQHAGASTEVSKKDVASETRNGDTDIGHFVDELYAQFKEQTIRELRQQEARVGGQRDGHVVSICALYRLCCLLCRRCSSLLLV